MTPHTLKSVITRISTFRSNKIYHNFLQGKGMMETFWLEGEVEEEDQNEALQLFSAMCGEN